MDPKEKANLLHQRLMDLYGYPEWRDPLPPMDELVCTILSQNTNDVNRDRGFNQLLARFDSWEDVRKADVDEIIDAIRVAGLANQKGKRIKQVLNQIYEERGDLDLTFLKDIPREEALAWLVKFKGVGPKTAAIVLQFSLDIPAFPVDTHVNRVTGRLGIRPEKMSVEQAHGYMESLLPPETYYSAHLNIIRFGRQICHARKPACDQCPLTDICDFYQANPSQE
jgi:endonuclease-3